MTHRVLTPLHHNCSFLTKLPRCSRGKMLQQGDFHKTTRQVSTHQRKEDLPITSNKCILIEKWKQPITHLNSNTSFPQALSFFEEILTMTYFRSHDTEKKKLRVLWPPQSSDMYISGAEVFILTKQFFIVGDTENTQICNENCKVCNENHKTLS